MRFKLSCCSFACLPSLVISYVRTYVCQPLYLPICACGVHLARLLVIQNERDCTVLFSQSCGQQISNASMTYYTYSYTTLPTLLHFTRLHFTKLHVTTLQMIQEAMSMMGGKGGGGMPDMAALAGMMGGSAGGSGSSSSGRGGAREPFREIGRAHV